MASYAGLRKISADEVLFKEGDVGPAAFLLVDGKVALYRGNAVKPSFRHVLQATAKAPQLLGKAALLGEKFQISARTLSGVSVVPVERAAFAPLLAKADPMLRLMLTAMLQDVVLFAPEAPT
jgi:CRP-like cAMP-binding protein